MKASSRSARSARPIGRAASSLCDNHYIFVYGTLKKGGKFHHELTKDPTIRFAGEARIRARLYELPGEDYPGAVPTTKNSYVHGQLFSTEDPLKTLRALDEFEGVDEGLFRRKKVDAWRGRKRTKAWAYFYTRSVNEANLLSDGVYS